MNHSLARDFPDKHVAIFGGSAGSHDDEVDALSGAHDRLAEPSGSFDSQCIAELSRLATGEPRDLWVDVELADIGSSRIRPEDL